MAHYAFIDDQNIVCEVIVGNDENSGVDWESYYAAIRGMRCLRTSYNTARGVHALGGTPFRGNYAGVGFVYREDMDAFLPPCPGEGFTIDAATFGWSEAAQN
jgi:hypothetical protein